MGQDDDPPHRDATEVEDLVPRDSETGPLSPPDETEDEVLRLTRKESREVLDHQISLLNDLDDKAMRTVRTSVLVLSIIFSAAGIVGTKGLQKLGYWPLRISALGVGGLFLTIVYGVITYSDSETEFGPNTDFRLEARREVYTEREWLNLLLEGYNEWIDVMQRVNSRNATRLNRIQFLLIASLFCFMLALGLFAF